ncbi:unnamed protein product, partial [Choristocarpus tenellus]
MPATAGRVRMPHNNRMSSSSALKMTGIWTNTIGYDPYAAEDGAQVDEDSQNAYEQAQGLMALAKLSNQGVTEQRGACKKCGMVGHLTIQCRNHIQPLVDGAAVGQVSRKREDVEDSSDDDDISDVSSISDS